MLYFVFTPTLDMLYLIPDLWHVIFDTGTWHVILDTWSTTLDIWHRYLICHTWHLILTPDIWHMLILMLSHGTSTLTWYCDTWPDTITPDTCIIWHIHDYHFYGDLAWLLYCYQIFGTPELLCSWTPVYLNHWNRETPDITPDIILLLIPVIG